VEKQYNSYNLQLVQGSHTMKQTINTYSLNCLRQINSRFIEITTKATKQVQNVLIIVGLQNNKHNQTDKTMTT
jgi:hypothetical protein